MIESMHEKIDVQSVYNKAKNAYRPVALRWNGRAYRIVKLGYYHKYRQGRVVIHVFSVATKSLAFRLELNSETLEWTLTQVSDGVAN